MRDEPADLNFKELKELIESWVCTEGDAVDRESFQDKLDILERTLACLRIEFKCLENKLPLETFIQGCARKEQNLLSYCFPEKPASLGSGTPPIQLQPMLLTFLLLHHREAYTVYDIIEVFIDQIWDQLHILDFKRTKTGVIRCFTNTRFAAHTLRDAGLLRFTRKEAYRTWVLSLSGFLVASLLVKWSRMDFAQFSYLVYYAPLLHPAIWEACNSVKTYDMFVKVLAQICEPNTEVFSTFDEVLRQAYVLLEKYWRIVQNPSLSVKERKEISMEHVKRLEETPDIQKFYSEFSKCVNVERLLRDV
ncbi:MAG TPA: hypothetical protein VMX13_13705 [Sedimentisphaerales bacterium]|nr:hypothetical protein [Sedimentisphaerales bacterium]